MSERIIKTGLGPRYKDMLDAVIGQMSDGWWENTPMMRGYWMFVETGTSGNEVTLNVDEEPSARDGNDRVGNRFYDMSDDAIKKFFADKIKFLIKEEGLGKWDRGNEAKTDFLSYRDPYRVKDCYYAYEVLKGRDARKHAEYGDVAESKQPVKIKLVQNEAAGTKQIIAYPADFKKTRTLYICPDTKANRKLIDDADVKYSIDTAADSDFITGMDEDGATGTVPYSKFLKNVKGAYSAVMAARESGEDSIGTTKFDIPDMALGFAGIDPIEMEDSDLEDLDSFLAYVWQDLRDICNEYVAHIKDGKVVDNDAYIRGHVAGDKFKVAAFPGA